MKETKQSCIWQSSVKPQSLPTQNLSPWNWLHFSHWGRELTSPLIYMLLGLLTWFNRQNLVKFMAFQVYSQASSNLVLFCSFSLSLFPLPLWRKPWLIEGFRDTWKVSYFGVGFLVQHASVDLLVNHRFMSADKTNQAWLGSSEPHSLTRDVRNDWFL